MNNLDKNLFVSVMDDIPFGSKGIFAKTYNCLLTCVNKYLAKPDENKSLVHTLIDYKNNAFIADGLIGNFDYFYKIEDNPTMYRERPVESIDELLDLISNKIGNGQMLIKEIDSKFQTTILSIDTDGVIIIDKNLKLCKIGFDQLAVQYVFLDNSLIGIKEKIL